MARPQPASLSFDLAHSLGGIVLKQALVSLANGVEYDNATLQAIQEAVFFGVPNLSMEQAHFEAVVHEQPNMDLVATLSTESMYLWRLNEQFSGITYLQDALLYWGYETKISPTVITPMAKDKESVMRRYW
ncbi:hypothetical protein F4804DRAFT_146188 [Jackrogersella minutella]|nr:hypothetical protein F4804DRAFT_146188 [Jackrogersella minutella]